MSSSQSSYIEVIRRGTPGAFFESIDVTNEATLREILDFSADELKRYGISSHQQEILREFLRIWDYRSRVMSSLEADISNIQSKMRTIRSNGIDYSENEPTEKEADSALELLRQEEESKRSEIDTMRRKLEQQLIALDQELGESFTETI